MKGKMCIPLLRRPRQAEIETDKEHGQLETHKDSKTTGKTNTGRGQQQAGTDTLREERCTHT